jgi:hypothetical protein
VSAMLPLYWISGVEEIETSPSKTKRTSHLEDKLEAELKLTAVLRY